MPEVINFYRVSDEHGHWSNLAEYPIYLGGGSWPASENYFQAQKFAKTDRAHATAIRRETPKGCTVLGRDRSHKMRADWDKPVDIKRAKGDDMFAYGWKRVVGRGMLVKDLAMLKAVRAKVRQHPELRKKLLDTGYATIVEHTEKDSYWGDGLDGSGQ